MLESSNEALWITQMNPNSEQYIEYLKRLIVWWLIKVVGCSATTASKIVRVERSWAFRLASRGKPEFEVSEPELPTPEKATPSVDVA